MCFFQLVFEAQFSGESGIVGLDTIVLGSPTDPAGCPDITTTTTVGTTAKPTVAPVPPITLRKKTKSNFVNSNQVPGQCRYHR